MLTQKINPLKLSLALYNDARESRFSMLDIITLLTINEHPQSSKSDINELVTGDRAKSKSTFDRPIQRLLDSGWIERIDIEKAYTKGNQAKAVYIMSKKGLKRLGQCV